MFWRYPRWVRILTTWVQGHLRNDEGFTRKYKLGTRTSAIVCIWCKARTVTRAHSFDLGSEPQRWADGTEGPCPGGPV
jgi:hypothetical protein